MEKPYFGTFTFRFEAEYSPSSGPHDSPGEIDQLMMGLEAALTHHNFRFDGYWTIGGKNYMMKNGKLVPYKPDVALQSILNDAGKAEKRSLPGDNVGGGG